MNNPKIIINPYEKDHRKSMLVYMRKYCRLTVTRRAYRERKEAEKKIKQCNRVIEQTISEYMKANGTITRAEAEAELNEIIRRGFRK